MSFLDDIGSTISGLFGGGSNNMLGGLLSTALTGFALYKVNSSVSAPTDIREPDLGSPITINPDIQAKIPVVYGTAYVPGIITEAVASNNNLTMTYCVTLSERTGALLSSPTGAASTFTFNNVYWNGNRIVFQGDGITANYTTDADGNIDYNVKDLVKVYCYNGSSTEPIAPAGYTNGSIPNAYAVVPNWDSTFTMNDLIFAVVQVTYNRDKGITDLPTMSFSISNSMTLPGDCIQDYMLSERYGAGIALEEIYSE